MTATADPFVDVLGRTRGAGRPDTDDPEFITAAKRRRRLLALIGAHGILGHNSAVQMPDSFTAGRIAELVDHGGRGDRPWQSPVSDELTDDLSALRAAGLLRCYQEQWQVTAPGLVALWTGIPPA